MQYPDVLGVLEPSGVCAADAVATALRFADPQAMRLLTLQAARLREDSPETRDAEAECLLAAEPRQEAARGQFWFGDLFADNLTVLRAPNAEFAWLYDDDNVSLDAGHGRLRWDDNVAAENALRSYWPKRAMVFPRFPRHISYDTFRPASASSSFSAGDM
jgi:hypothetical protein